MESMPFLLMYVQLLSLHSTEICKHIIGLFHLMTIQGNGGQISGLNIDINNIQGDLLIVQGVIYYGFWHFHPSPCMIIRWNSPSLKVIIK